MSGCGTHLVLDLFASVGIKRVTEPILLLQAMYLARLDAAAPCRMRDYAHLSAGQAVRELSRHCSVPPPDDVTSDEDCFTCFEAALGKAENEKTVFGHHYFLSHSQTVAAANGETFRWTLEDRNGVQDFLQRAVSALGIEFLHAAVLRNPVDIRLSQNERFKGSNSGETDVVDREIAEFFQSVAERPEPDAFPVVRYEDICKAAEEDLPHLLADLHFTTEEARRADRSLIHGGNTEKWRLYPPAHVSALAGKMKPHMDPFGYQVHPKNRLLHALSKPFQGLRKYRVEFRVINQLMAGDFSVDSAFSRHNRSIPARIWFRFRLLFPKARENVELFYRTRKDTPSIPTRPLSVVLKNLLGGTPNRKKPE